MRRNKSLWLFRTTGLLPCLIACVSMARGQETEDVLLPEPYLDEVVSADGMDIPDVVEKWKEHPFDLNAVSAEELEQLGFLDAFAIRALLSYRDRFGPFLSLYELAYIEGLDLQNVFPLLPYVTVEPVAEPSLRDLLRRGDHAWIFRGQEEWRHPHDPKSSAFTGSPLKLWTRYSFEAGKHIRAGFLTEKDAGEPLWQKHPAAGPDHVSFHVFYQGQQGWLRQVALGDYQCSFGQGLTAWTAFSSSGILPGPGCRKVERRIQAHTGSDENRFLRGAAVTLGHGDFRFTSFVSSKKTDARLTGSGSISSLVTTGMHRSLSEIKTKDAARELKWGGDLSYKTEFFQVGIVYFRTAFDKPFATGVKGTTPGATGIHFTWLRRKTAWFGESSFSPASGMAHVYGFRWHRDGVMWSVLFRHVGRSYQNTNGEVFGLGNNGSPVHALFSSIASPGPYGTNLLLYTDRKAYTWSTGNAHLPSVSQDWVARWSNSPYASTVWEITARSRMLWENGRQTPLKMTSLQTGNNLRFHLQSKAGFAWKWAVRHEIQTLRNEASHRRGHLSYVQVIWKKPAAKWACYIRYGLFSTPDYESRIYSYENDLWLIWYVPSFYGTGIRTYVGLQGAIGKRITFWAKYMRTVKQGDTILSATRSAMLRCQLRIRL